MNQEYCKRINTVFEYIDTNLDSELTLETISKIAFYSPFHFHRVFKLITNETLNNYITRRRIEKAASLLLHQKESTIQIWQLNLDLTVFQHLQELSKIIMI
ncbi:MAG: helix-turn-helix transcriptional regulator [Flavobacterium sp.]|nr:helix-turn-helix transcriptional regulator [Flavobacterium sp.]